MKSLAVPSIRDWVTPVSQNKFHCLSPHTEMYFARFSKGQDLPRTALTFRTAGFPLACKMKGKL